MVIIGTLSLDSGRIDLCRSVTSPVYGHVRHASFQHCLLVLRIDYRADSNSSDFFRFNDYIFPAGRNRLSGRQPSVYMAAS